jgi:hypothetical protein
MARWGHSDTDYLFWTYDFHGVQQNRREQLKQAINEAASETIRAGSVDDVASQFTNDFQLHAPELTEGAISATVDETQVDVSRDPSLSFQYGTFGRGPHHVSGITATYFVPYVGEREMFKVKPSTWTTVIPAAEVTATELRFRFVQAGENVAATKAAFDEELSRVKLYLGWLAGNVQTFNGSLLPYAKELVTQRRQRLEALNQGTSSLGIPIRRTADGPHGGRPLGPAIGRAPAAQARAAGQVERYDVALSFAGENRAYVEEVATGLKAAGASVFYDGFEKASLWGKNLIDHLADIYQHRSRYVVMFVSEHYAQKAWPTHERQHAQARALIAKDEYILPACFDDTEVPGMANTVGYVDLRTMRPSDLVVLILTKIRKI